MNSILIDGYEFEYIFRNGCHYLFGLDDEIKCLVIATRKGYDVAKEQARKNMHMVIEKKNCSNNA